MKKIVTLIFMVSLIISSPITVQCEQYEWTNKIGENAYITVRNEASIVTGTGAITEKYITAWGDLTISEGITEIGNAAFHSDSITSLSIPSTVTKIDKNAFKGCINLKKVIIPEGVVSVGEGIFDNCIDLKKIINHSQTTIPAPRKKWQADMGYKYYVDGKPAKEVPPGKTMIGKPITYKVKLYANGGKIKGKKVKKYMTMKYKYGTNPKLPKATKKGYEFIGWSENKKASNGVGILWRDKSYYGGEQKRYAQFAKVDIKAKKKSIRIKCTNYNTSQFIVSYSTKKDRSDEVKYCIYTLDGKIYCWDPFSDTDEIIQLKGKHRHSEKKYKNNYIDVAIPNLESGKKYYVRLRFWRKQPNPGKDDFGYSNYFGKRTIKTK